MLRTEPEGVVLWSFDVDHMWLPGEQRSCLGGRTLNMTTVSEQLWRELYDRLFAFAVRRVGAADADDLVQDVFVRMHNRIDTLDQADRLEAWAYQITRNAIVDHHRSRARHREVLAAEVDQHVLDGGAAPSADEYAEVDVEGELAGCLTPLVEQLAEPYRQAVGLVEFEALPQAQAAVRVGLSTSGMKSRVQRARRQLKELLLECCHVDLDRRGSVMGYRARADACGGCSPATASGPPCCGN